MRSAALARVGVVVTLVVAFAGVAGAMKPWDAAWARDLVAAAGWVEERRPGEAPRVHWVREVRARHVEGERWNLVVNGQVLELGQLWIWHGGEMVNLGVLFTYGEEPMPARDYRD